MILRYHRHFGEVAHDMGRGLHRLVDVPSRALTRSGFRGGQYVLQPYIRRSSRYRARSGNRQRCLRLDSQ